MHQRYNTQWLSQAITPEVLLQQYTVITTPVMATNHLMANANALHVDMEYILSILMKFYILMR